MVSPTVYLSGERPADALLSKDPLALLIGMLLDQQIPLERAFFGPFALQDRLGRHLDAADIASMDPDTLVDIFRQKPAIHRYPGSMAARVQQLCQVLVDQYGGKATAVWKSAKSGADVVSRLMALPGFGESKARIFTALLGKQFGLKAPGWEAASSPFGDPGTHRSVADIVDEASLLAVRAYKQSLKATAKADPRRT